MHIRSSVNNPIFSTLGSCVAHWTHSCVLDNCSQHQWFIFFLNSSPGLVRGKHYWLSKLTIIGSDNGLPPSHHLNQCWNIVNWILGNKLQWNFNQNLHIFIQENVFHNVVCEMAAILSKPQCVNWIYVLMSRTKPNNLFFIQFTWYYGPSTR